MPAAAVAEAAALVAMATASATGLGFVAGDRVVITKAKHNPLNHKEVYHVGEHGTIVHTAEGSSVVRVRLDGHGGEHGNFYVVESVLPLVQRPVPHRIVDVSVLHLKKENEAKPGDFAVFASEDGMEEVVGRVRRVLKDEDDEGPAVLDVQPYSTKRWESPRPLHEKRWRPCGEPRTLSASAARSFVHMHDGQRLRPCDVHEVRSKALLTEHDKIPGFQGDRTWPPGAPSPRSLALQGVSSHPRTLALESLSGKDPLLLTPRAIERLEWRSAYYPRWRPNNL